MKRLLNGALAALILLSCVGSVMAADVKPLGNVGGAVRPFHTGETVPITNGGTGSVSASAARTALGVAIGTNVQAYDADLTTYAGITPSANVQTLLGSVDYSAFRTSLDVYSKAAVDSAVASGTVSDGDKGDVVVSSTGTVYTIDTNVVGNTKLRQSGALAVVGRSANSTGNVADIQATAATDSVLRESGSTIGFGTIVAGGIASDAVTTAKILNANVTLAKIANAAASSKLLGSGASGSGAAYAEITLGTNLSMSGTTLNASGGGGSSKPFITFRPFDNEPPATNFASLDTRNGHPVLNFDTTTQETAIFSGVLPTGYAGGGLKVTVIWAAATATTGTIGWDTAFERIDAGTLDIDADSFASANTITAATVSGTSGVTSSTNTTHTSGAQMDSLAAGEPFRLRVRRDVANDTATGDAQIVAVVVEEP